MGTLVRGRVERDRYLGGGGCGGMGTLMRGRVEKDGYLGEGEGVEGWVP